MIFCLVQQISGIFPKPRKTYDQDEVAQIAFYSFIFLAGTVGNAVVIKNFVSPHRRDKPGSYFVAALAAVDMLASITIPCLYVTKMIFKYPLDQPLWPWGKATCYIATICDSAVYFISALLLAAISLERTR